MIRFWKGLKRISCGLNRSIILFTTTRNCVLLFSVALVDNFVYGHIKLFSSASGWLTNCSLVLLRKSTTPNSTGTRYVKQNKRCWYIYCSATISQRENAFHSTRLNNETEPESDFLCCSLLAGKSGEFHPSHSEVWPLSQWHLWSQWPVWEWEHDPGPEHTAVSRWHGKSF